MLLTDKRDARTGLLAIRAILEHESYLNTCARQYTTRSCGDLLLYGLQPSPTDSSMQATQAKDQDQHLPPTESTPNGVSPSILAEA